MSRFVRASKFRNVFGTAAKKENNYDGLKPSRSAWDNNKVCCSTNFLGIIWDASGGGAFAVIPVDKPGKLGQIPLIAGHSGEVLDIEFNPFNPCMIGSASEDGYAKIWVIPQEGLKETVTTPAQSLSGHKRKVGTINFNPIAENIIATTSTDFTVKIWDIEKGDVQYDIPGHADIIQSSGWNYNGSLFTTASKDKKVRVVDLRAAAIVQEVEAHAGVKGMRAMFLGHKDKIFSMGFSKTSERQYSLWDPRNFTTPMHTENVDTAAGLLMPFYDDDSNVLFLAGKGDGNIRYYELVDEAPYIYFLTEFKSATPQRGMGSLPKLALNVMDCEIARLMKLTASAIEPISFNVPRKSDIFQDDLYPATFSGEPTLTAGEWSSGKNGEPKTCAISPGYVAPVAKQTQFTAKAEAPPKTEKELLKESEDQARRIAYLEAELVKRDARIKELESK